MPAAKVPDAIRRIFTATFFARDLAEPLASFDATTSAAEVRQVMEAHNLSAAGVRSEGQVTGFVQRDSLIEGVCGDRQRSFDEATVLDEDAPLLTVLTELNRAPFLFVRVFGKVGGLITLADLQKAPVRMWLFGIVTLIELRCSELIEQHCPGDSWQQFLSEGRLQKAKDLLEQRRKRRQELQLRDCLQFSDKREIIARNEEIRRRTVFASRREAEDAMKALESLRDNLAHAQDFLACDWNVIVRLCKFITELS